MNQENACDLLAYLVSSAVNCQKEPKIYGSLRLIEAAERLIGQLSSDGLLQDPKMQNVAEKIEAGKFLCMTDEAGFYRMLKDISVDLAEIIIAF